MEHNFKKCSSSLICSCIVFPDMFQPSLVHLGKCVTVIISDVTEYSSFGRMKVLSLLGTFTVTKSTDLLCYVHPSVHMYQCGSHWMDSP